MINFGNQEQFENHERIFDHNYARRVCHLFFQNKTEFEKEWKNYDHKRAKNIYNYAVKHGEEKATPYYLQYKETYQRSNDLKNIRGLISLGASCEYLEKEGFFGKQ